ncbi:hypothetical protein [Corynebacterium sp. H113]|uniref:hypothetical protein n=1 Tax=Corynebacterium sp. H113 TaxID=3133419 RepID=UPI0030B784D3
MSNDQDSLGLPQLDEVPAPPALDSMLQSVFDAPADDSLSDMVPTDSDLAPDEETVLEDIDIADVDDLDDDTADTYADADVADTADPDSELISDIEFDTPEASNVDSASGYEFDDPHLDSPELYDDTTDVNTDDWGADDVF